VTSVTARRPVRQHR